MSGVKDEARRVSPGERMLDPTGLKVPGAEPLKWGTLKGDGVTLRHARVTPLSGRVRATLVLVHGRTEFIEKYREVMSELVARDVEVFTLDWRGQGLSTRVLDARDKGHVTDFRHYVEDMRRYVDRVVRPQSPAALYLLSHSMGGNIALHYLREHPGVFRRALLVAPMVDIELGLGRVLVRGLVRGLGQAGYAERYAPGTGPYRRGEHRFAGNDLTSDQERFAATHRLLERAPELALGGPTLGWLDEAFKSTSRLFEPGYPEGITTPTTFIVAGADSVVDNAQTKRLAVRMVRAEVLSVGGSKHELLNERDLYLEQFWSLFDARVL